MVMLRGTDPGDVIQGQLADCWILSSLAILATDRSLVEKLFVSTDYGEEYGCPHAKRRSSELNLETDGRLYVCRFYKAEEWVTVIVDDRIPCHKVTRQPIFARCKEPNEIWVPILEKAYAKLHGTYEALAGGEMNYALKDLTGGAPYEIDLESPVSKAKATDRSLFRLFRDMMHSGHIVLLGCAHIKWEDPPLPRTPTYP